MSNKIYPIGIQNFKKIRKEGLFHIDKTVLVYQMVKTGSYYFLNRPRRFGKSLLVSTFEAYFQRKKELFEGLATGKLEKEWIKHLILHLDLNIEKCDSLRSLEDILEKAVVVWEKLCGTEPLKRSLSLRFAGVIERACKQAGHRVVILVDEYDKPMLQSIGDEELQKEFRKTLQAFYGAIKTMNGYIRLAFLTGVTKFGKMSVFSASNNLIDLSMDEHYVALCGITEEEIRTNLEQELYELADRQRMGYERVCRELKECYDGYHSVEDSIGICNPFSPLNMFCKMKLGDYRFETGTPTYLVELLQAHHYDLHKMVHVETDADVLNSISSSSTNPIPVIYQSGYLTIKGYDREFGIYRLGFPSREVEKGFMKFLLPYHANTDKVETPFGVQKFVREIRAEDYDSFFRCLQSFFADTTYEIIREQELHYQNVPFVVFKLVGFYTNVEYRTSEGHIDLVLQAGKFIYVMELKLDSTAEEALRQTSEKHYVQPFAADSRKLLKIGVDFSAKTRNIEKWIVEL